MTNEELKKKICEIIAPYVSAWGEDERIADALIAAGIGDVKELQLDKKAYEAASNHYRILFEEAERRAEIAEKALCNALNDDSCYFCNKKSPCECEHRDWGSKECITVLLRQAEKELAEGKDD